VDNFLLALLVLIVVAEVEFERATSLQALGEPVWLSE
jgi:hypothetical protein